MFLDLNPIKRAQKNLISEIENLEIIFRQFLTDLQSLNKEFDKREIILSHCEKQYNVIKADAAKIDDTYSEVIFLYGKYLGLRKRQMLTDASFNYAERVSRKYDLKHGKWVEKIPEFEKNALLLLPAINSDVDFQPEEINTLLDSVVQLKISSMENTIDTLMDEATSAIIFNSILAVFLSASPIFWPASKFIQDVVFHNCISLFYHTCQYEDNNKYLVALVAFIATLAIVSFSWWVEVSDKKAFLLKLKTTNGSSVKKSLIQELELKQSKVHKAGNQKKRISYMEIMKASLCFHECRALLEAARLKKTSDYYEKNMDLALHDSLATGNLKIDPSLKAENSSPPLSSDTVTKPPFNPTIKEEAININLD